MELVWPGREHLDGYVAALRRGWSANTMDDAARERDLAAIAVDADAFLASLVDREGTGTITLPDGSVAPRIPGYRRWIHDHRGFAGSIGLRWQPGTTDLPPHVLGHIGYAVVPWRRNEGLATAALGRLLPDAAAERLAFVELTTDLENIASQRVITANGGTLVRHDVAPPELGGHRIIRWRIDLALD